MASRKKSTKQTETEQTQDQQTTETTETSEGGDDTSVDETQQTTETQETTEATTDDSGTGDESGSDDTASGDDTASSTDDSTDTSTATTSTATTTETVATPSQEALAAVKNAFDDYITVMGPGVPHTDASIASNQLKLRKAFNLMLRVADSQFEEAIKLARKIIRNHRSDVFSERMVFRGFSTLKISSDERKRLETLVSLMLAYADANQKSQVPKQIDFDVAMRYIPKEDEQQKLRSFFDQ